MFKQASASASPNDAGFGPAGGDDVREEDEEEEEEREAGEGAGGGGVSGRRGRSARGTLAR